MKEPEVVRQLRASGYWSDISGVISDAATVRGRLRLDAIERLRSDARFANGALHGLHQDVGDHRIDFRSYNGEFGKGSLQIVVDKKTGRCYVDVDKHNPYQDLVRFIGHTGEVIHGWLSGWKKG